MLHEVLKQLEHYFSILDTKSYDLLKQAYETNLFRKDKPSTFKDKEGHLFSGYIQGVSDSGHLNVLIEDDIVKSYDLKELQLLF